MHPISAPLVDRAEDDAARLRNGAPRLGVIRDEGSGMSLAQRRARENADALANELSCATGPAAFRLDACDRASYDIGRYIGHGHLDRLDAADLLHNAATACGLYADLGVDAVQESINAGFRAGENAALDDRAAAEGAGSTLPASDSALLAESRCIAEVAPEAVEWLWDQRLALGKPNLMAGLPGVGKTQFCCALAAAVTTGGLLPDNTDAPLGSVVFIGCEDGVADTIRPRLEAAGAALERCHALDWVKVKGKKGIERRHFDVREHGEALRDLCQRIGDVKLIIIDPITAHSGKTDTHCTADVRAALVPLQTTAEEIGACVVMISHLNKGGSTDGSAMARVNGSGAYIAVSRSAWLIGADPKDVEGKRMVFACLKNNLSPVKTGIAYTIEGIDLGVGIKTSRCKFDPIPTTITADELVQPNAAQAEERKTARNDALAFLRKQLAAGPIPSKELEEARKAQCIAPATLKRARKELGVEAFKDGDVWKVRLPNQEDQEDQQYQDQV